MTAPGVGDLFRFVDIAHDVGLIFGSTTDQGLVHAKRCLNRAAIEIAGHDRRWTWMRVKDSLLTTADEPEYSLPADFRKEEQFWIQESARRKLKPLPAAQRTEFAPDAALVTGTPEFYDFEGVDSSGSRILLLYPTPSAADIEIWFRYSRFLLPIKEDEKSLRSWWGMPPNVIGVLTKKAGALAIEGINSARYFQKNKEADDEIDAAYAADQSRPDAVYRAKLVGEHDRFRGPQLPPDYER